MVAVQVIRFSRRLYQVLISPAIHLVFGAPCGCRFTPTCSAYAEQALLQHGWLKGISYLLLRLMRCHPWSAAGYDPVPHAIAGNNYGSKNALSN